MVRIINCNLTSQPFKAYFGIDDFNPCFEALNHSFSYLEWVGDGVCDDPSNIIECQYDGGDCCLDVIDDTYCSACECYGYLTTTLDSQGPVIISYFNGTHDVEVEYSFDDDLIPTTLTDLMEESSGVTTETTSTPETFTDVEDFNYVDIDMLQKNDDKSKGTILPYNFCMLLFCISVDIILRPWLET